MGGHVGRERHGQSRTPSPPASRTIAGMRGARGAMAAVVLVALTASCSLPSGDVTSDVGTPGGAGWSQGGTSGDNVFGGAAGAAATGNKAGSGPSGKAGSPQAAGGKGGAGDAGS